MRKALIVTGALLGVVVIGGVGADRVAASAAERAITEKVQAEFAGAEAVSTQVHGVPLLTQVAGGSLDHVTVSMTGVSASAGVTLDDVVVDLYDVSTAEPRMAQTVDASAVVPTATLQAKLGTDWTVVPDGGLLVVTSANLPVTVRVTPVVKDGAVAFDLDSVEILGVRVSGDSIPQDVTDRIAALVVPATDLPFGLTITSVTVTPEGVGVAATGTDIPLVAA